MFSFFIKKSEVILDCFTTDMTIFSATPIQKGTNFIPSWWKSLPDASVKNKNVDIVPGSTMKHCIGFTNYFHKSVVMPLWSDLIICTEEQDYWYQFADNSSIMYPHNPIQYNFTYDFFHAKIDSKWIFSCKEDINFFMAPPQWDSFLDNNFTENVHFISGLLDFKYQTSTNINLFLSRKVNRFELLRGIPLVFFFPLTDKKIKIVNHLITEQEFNKTKLATKSFKREYLSRKHLIKKNNFY